MKIKNLIIQFIRYVIVGGISFITDFITLSLVYKIFLKDWNYGLFIGAAAGFIVGTVVNYCLSKRFIFVKAAARTKSIVVEFLLYAIIGVIGLFLTEVGMYFGVGIISCNYAIIKIIVTGIVFVWNFMVRRFLLYK